MFFERRANELQNFIINQKLEKVFSLVESDIPEEHGFRYSFFRHDSKGQSILINSFSIFSDTKELDSLAMFEYCLGFMDSYLIFKR